MILSLKPIKATFSTLVLCVMLMMFISLSLSGCGNKGPLTKPEQLEKMKKS